MENVRLRGFQTEDGRATAEIFYRSVRCGARAFYDERQRRAWAPRIPDAEAWLARLRLQTVLVAERDGAVLGFMSLSAEGCIDLAYVAPEAIGRGIGRALYDAIVREALRLGLTRLETEASHYFRRLLARRGWSVVEERTVLRDGVPLHNFLMEKRLSEGPDASRTRQAIP